MLFMFKIHYIFHELIIIIPVSPKVVYIHLSVNHGVELFLYPPLLSPFPALVCLCISFGDDDIFEKKTHLYFPLLFR